MANIRYFNNYTTESKSSNILSDIYEAILENNEKVLRLLETPGLNINEQLNISSNPFRYTLLHHAIDMRSSKAVIKKLLLLGADLSIKDKRGRTCYDLLSCSGNGELVKDIYSIKEEQVETLQSKLDNRAFNEKQKENTIKYLNEEKLELIKVLDKIRLEKQNLQGELMETRKRKIELETENTDLKTWKKKIIATQFKK
jgi:ankyrin repeat protein